MKSVNLLEFLNNTKTLYTLDYAVCDKKLINFLDLLSEDEQFTRKINFGIIYLIEQTLDKYIIVDGYSRILSLSLLLHAVCECYKKTTSQNEKAIKTIRQKYLLHGANKTKLRLRDDYQVIYDKIIFGEKLSGQEKDNVMFKLLHNFWTQIKEEKLSAASIFNMLGKIEIVITEAENVPTRDLYYTLNKDKRNINQQLLIEDYLKEKKLQEQWQLLKDIFNSSMDLNLFFKDFLVTKFNFKEYNPDRLYDTFINYFETMLQYLKAEVVFEKMIRSAKLYNEILNVNIPDEDLKQVLIRIKMHNGEDTYSYILNIYEDYCDGNITKITFIEILSTIDEYLRNRSKTGSNVAFIELIRYLNAFMTCK